MTRSKIVCVVPTVRPECHEKFVAAWRPLFEKHRVTLVTVWDGERPRVQIGYDPKTSWYADELFSPSSSVPVDRSWDRIHDLFCRRTDACRNLGFVAAGGMNPDLVWALDDDCYPCTSNDPTTRELAVNLFDPIQAHIDALSRRVSLSWMNTAHDTDLYLRGVPYGVRDEAPVMLSHGVWVGTPDFDGETQLRLETGTKTVYVNKTGRQINKGEWVTSDMVEAKEVPTGVPHSLPYYVGPVPRGVLFPLSGMNVMVRREALPYLYYAPMGPDSGVVCPTCDTWGIDTLHDGRTGKTDHVTCPTCNGSGSNLHRFADIFMGVFLKRQFDALGWACVTGYSTVHHTRASDARKNFEQEKLGREWMEQINAMSFICDETWKSHAPTNPPGVDETMWDYFRSYADKRDRYARLVRGLLNAADPNAEEYRK